MTADKSQQPARGGISFRYYFLGVVLASALLVAMLLLIPGKQPTPPLPFDTKGFVASNFTPLLAKPANPSLKDRLFFGWIELMRLFKADTWSFPATPGRCSIHGLLNQCMQVSGNRYLLSPEIASGSAQLSATNTLDGPQWVAEVERTLHTGKIEWWDSELKGWRKEPLVFIRFPAQKTVLILPELQAVEFLRTNATGRLDEKFH